MRAVGEAKLSSLAQAKWMTKISRGRNNRVVCKCGVVAWVAIGALKQYKGRGYGYVCQTCKDTGDKEMLAARIAIAKRKGLIP